MEGVSLPHRHFFCADESAKLLYRPRLEDAFTDNLKKSGTSHVEDIGITFNLAEVESGFGIRLGGGEEEFNFSNGAIRATGFAKDDLDGEKRILQSL